jgi:hypothetical protein
MQGLGPRLGQLKTVAAVGVDVPRHRHRARRHPGGAAQPDPRKEHVGQRRQRIEIGRARRVVAHPHPGQAAAFAVRGLAFPTLGHRADERPHATALQPFNPARRRRQVQGLVNGVAVHGGQCARPLAAGLSLG